MQINPRCDQLPDSPDAAPYSPRSRRILSFLCVVLSGFASPGLANSQPTVEQWGIFELSLKGPTNGSPFLDAPFSAQFTFDYADSAATDVSGFYDGDGIYRVRFMPPTAGPWHYMTHSSISELDRKSGQFTVAKSSSQNHGPVHVTNTFHFAYADGNPFKQLGTTCYAWIHQTPALEERTLKTLAS